MSDDQLFRLILLAGFVIFMPIGIYHRLRSRTGEKLDRRQEGIFILVALRLAGLAGTAGLMRTSLTPPTWHGLPCHCRSGCAGRVWVLP